MTLGEALKRAIEERNHRMAGRIVDRLRFSHGWNYQKTYGLAQKLTGIDLAEWDALMEAADHEEGGDHGQG